MKMTERELTVLARLGSGSACRSVPDGFVKWETGESSEQSFAHSLYPPRYWDILDILVIVEPDRKDVSSSAGQTAASSSPYYKKRLEAVPGRIVRLETALRRKDFREFGEVTEEDCLDMHRCMQTQKPPLLYRNDTTKKITDAVGSWRKKGIGVYFTVDAGPNVHLICENHDEKRVTAALRSISAAALIINRPAQGTRIIADHLF